MLLIVELSLVSHSFYFLKNDIKATEHKNIMVKVLVKLMKNLQAPEGY